MNPEYNIQDKIDRYLNNEMNESEKLEFEAQLSVDNDLVNAFKAQKVANKIIIGEELIKLKTQMSRDLDSGNYSRGIQGNIGLYLLTGAAVAVIATILYFLMKDQNEINKTEIVKEKTTLPKTIESSQITVDSTMRNSDDAGNNSLMNQEKTRTIVQHQNSDQNKNNKTNFCKDSIISFSCQARGTCIQKNEGAIEIDINTIKSIDAPFLFSVSPKKDFHNDPIITDLKSGIYTLYVKDSKQCLHELNVKVEVPTIDCK